MQDPERLEEELRIKEEELDQITTGVDRHHQRRTEMRQKLDELRKQRPLVFGEVALEKRDPDEKESLKEELRLLEDEVEELENFILPWLGDQERQLKKEIAGLKRKLEGRRTHRT